jgi:Family of unknown function (DUF6627)
MMRVKTWPAQLLSGVLVVTMLSGVLPCRPAWAELVATESVVTPAPSAEGHRARLRALLDREDVRAQLQVYGVGVDEAAARVEALTDREVALLAGRLDAVPAGGDGVAVLVGLMLLGAAVVVAGVVGFIVLIVKHAANAAKQKTN